jgi:putative beta-lysine N-acetyltransferase
MKLMYDKIEEHCGCIIQHGPMNDRIYLMKVTSSAVDPVSDLIKLAEKNNYSKIFAKVSSQHKKGFLDKGFILEASIPNFYSNDKEACFLGLFLDKKRQDEKEKETIEQNLKLALEKKQNQSTADLTDKFILRKCVQSDAKEMTEVYSIVFPSYPFPIHEVKYLQETMESHIDYFCIEHENRIVAISSAEKDVKESNAEMTDFATLPKFRGNGLSQCLLAEMEHAMQSQNILTAYTIARAMSAGMNIVFSRAGYSYGGRLKNNTNISGSIESMNIWYKKLS